MNEKELRLLEYWNNLKPFKDEFDIPDLPITDSESWKNFYVPKLIELGADPYVKIGKNPEVYKKMLGLVSNNGDGGMTRVEIDSALQATLVTQLKENGYQLQLNFQH